MSGKLFKFNLIYGKVMKILIINAFSKNYEGRKRFTDFLFQIKKVLPPSSHFPLLPAPMFHMFDVILAVQGAAGDCRRREQILRTLPRQALGLPL